MTEDAAEEALPELDNPDEFQNIRDACDVLTRLSRHDMARGDHTGQKIDTGDDLDSGVARFALAQPVSQQNAAIAKARQMRDALLDHGAGRVQSPFTGKAGGVSIELIPGRGPSNNLWYTNTYKARLHHHTASAKITSARLTPALGIVKNGRSDLEGPLANGYGGGDFVYRIITFGWANHPGLGGPRNYGTGTIPQNNGRPYLWGTEWDWDGVSPWPQEYLEWMARCDAGLADYWGLPAGAQDEHKGWAMPPGRKSDRVAITRAQSIANTQRYWDAAAEEDDVSYADAVKALRDVLHLPESGLAVPQGQPNNGNFAVNTTTKLNVAFNQDNAQNAALSALKASQAAIHADQKVSGEKETEALAKLDEIIALVDDTPSS